MTLVREVICPAALEDRCNFAKHGTNPDNYRGPAFVDWIAEAPGLTEGCVKGESHVKKYRWPVLLIVVLALAVLAAGCGTKEDQKQVADLQQRVAAIENKVGNVEGTSFNGKDISILGTTPKFAITMREYGDRFSDMYYAAKGGNWALAAYLDHYLRASLNWTKITKPKEQEAIKSFHQGYLDPLLVTVGNKDLPAFLTQYQKTLEGCNGCHKAMGYGFITVGMPKAPADNHFDYNQKTAPTDFKEFVMPGK